MSRPRTAGYPAQALAAAVADYQRTTVIPHCAQCARPCCQLDTLVLELNWQQLKSFWRIEEARPAFDRRLAAGAGPEEIRAGNGRYYAHTKPCPAYDQAGHRCTVYNQPIKPAGCSDFPVYEDGDRITVDLRCEAVDVEALAGRIARRIGPGYRLIQSADRDFPFLVSLAVKAVPPQRV